ncbi:chemotaxis response regulator protein-glutamate methylesterase [Brucepastera parasyntrophica]|uniref:protein-glutamate methylesterase/protein-glutamine glutaminase n=1 Tax=Brucepastera parasyntrophica TaxID=2880008 RepID=UPI00210C7180|nr:chemotaxis response regulator protein-glutamate methylesterase [Brucepastera parasyntrophica]ULQ58922.1 chemotaxis response regulator protein-glutamate methylesterase [Brucepastera parasyntrophica]
MINVMIIDDSAVVRQTISEILSGEPDIKVIATASDPYDAAEKLKHLVPDVIILDIEMPRMDGLTFLKKLMSQHPLPVIICSSKAEEGSQNVFQAMQFGAVDIIQKPKVGTKQFIEDSRVMISDAVRAAHMTQVKKLSPNKIHTVAPKLTADVIMPMPSHTINIDTTESVVAIGASTGGTEALRVLLEKLPIDCPGIVIVQHMPEHFTAAFAARLNGICQVNVREAEDNDSVLRGRVLIAPGNKHLLLKRAGARYYVEVKTGPLVSRHRPSVDVLFRSTARYAGKNAIGVIMTGMGDDGAKGMLEMKESGAYNIAQDEASCVVFGMPKEAIKLGAVDKILPLEEIADHIIRKSNTM